MSWRSSDVHDFLVRDSLRPRRGGAGRDLADLEDLEKNLTLSKKLGYEGMLVLHPKEINIVHRYYSPTEEDLNEAKDILRLSEEAQRQNKGVAIMNGKFIGPPMVASAKLLLMKDELIKSKKN